jgi:hypothetical protein
MNDTAVTKWLHANSADDLIVKAFYDQEFYEIADVTDDNIETIAKGKPGLANRLKRTAHEIAAKQKAAEEQAAEKKNASKEKREPLPPPDLPAGETFDLTAPVLQHADVKFEIPTALQVEKGDRPRTPEELKNEEWMVIAKYSKFVYGFDMSTSAPERPREPVLYWKVPSETETFVRNEEDRARVSSSVTYTAETSSYVRAGFDREKATASYAFCSASIERSHKEKHAQSLSRSRRYMIGLWRYPRAVIFLDACTTVSPRFVDAVKTAVAANDPRAALEKVLKRFGHVVPSEILLGGQLVLNYSEENDASASEEENEDVISAAVSVKVGGASGSISGSKGTSTDEKHSAERIAQQTSFEAVGGNTLLASNPSSWVATLADPNVWAVIENRDASSTLDLLPDDLKNQALKFWPIEEEPLPPPSARSPNINYQANADGFLSAWMRVGGEGDGAEIYGYTDSNSDPKTHRVSAGVHWYKAEHVMNASLLMPVRAKDRFNLGYAPRWGNPPIVALFQPFPLSFGEWEPLELNKRYPKRDKDGFVVARLQYASDGDRGYIIGSQTALGQDLVQCAASSVHWYDHSDVRIAAESFCMPVVRGSDYRVDYVPTAGGPQVAAYWLPMGKSHKMLPLERRDVNKINRADTNGILTGFLHADHGRGGGGGGLVVGLMFDNSEGTLNLQVSETEDFANPTSIAVASAQTTSMFDKIIPYNSATVVVRKGNSYRAAFGQSERSAVTPTVSWVGIVQA